jgi:hypothetical protein
MAYDDDAVVVGALFFRHVHFFAAAPFTGEWIETQPWTSFIFNWLKLLKNIIDDAMKSLLVH